LELLLEGFDLLLEFAHFVAFGVAGEFAQLVVHLGDCFLG
jgi:hypothetical protein